MGVVASISVDAVQLPQSLASTHVRCRRKKVHVRYLISWWILVCYFSVRWIKFAACQLFSRPWQGFCLSHGLCVCLWQLL